MKHESINATLECSHCKTETMHELVYAGRLLASTTCSVCKTKVMHEADDLRVAYVKDLEHRIKTKPFRLWRRFWRNPTKTFTEFPSQAIAQPRKFWDEIKSLFNK